MENKIVLISCFVIAVKEFPCVFESHLINISTSRLLGWFLFCRAPSVGSMIPPFKIVLNSPDILSGSDRVCQKEGYS